MHTREKIDREKRERERERERELWEKRAALTHECAQGVRTNLLGK